MKKLAYTVREAAAETGLSTDTVKRAIRAGDLVTADPRVGGRPIQVTLIKCDELERWLDNGSR